MKCFYVENGHDVRHRHAWYGPGLRLIVEPGEDIEVYAAPHGLSGSCLGSYRYSQLDPTSPPQGLRHFHSDQPSPARMGSISEAA